MHEDPTTAAAAAYHRGAHKRAELLDIARKVRRDLNDLSLIEPMDPYLITRLDAILSQAADWRETPIDTSIPAQLAGELHLWERSILDLLEVITGLGNYCFVRLKKHRRSQSNAAAVVPAEDYRKLKRRNVLLNNIEMLLGRTSLQSYPHQMEIDPTNDCNLKCRSCQHSLLDFFYRAELRPEYMERLRDALPFVDYLHLYGNGEPFLASSLGRMVEVAREYQCTVDVLTNGTRLLRTDFDWSRISRLGISFDGATESTARLLRPGSRVHAILDGIRRVRNEAPDLRIYAKVTLNRVNLDELATIVECLGRAGVNEVILHSLRSYHPDQVPLQVRVSDRPFAMQKLKEAEAVAARLGVHLLSTITFDDFALPGTCKQHKQDLLVYLENLPLPAQRVPQPVEVIARLRELEFSYYPPVLVPSPVGKTRAERTHAEHFPLEPNLSAVDQTIRTLVGQAQSRKAPPLPYCFMPWKLPFIDPDGRARICDFLPDFVGDMEDSTTFREVWNSPTYQRIRRAMFDTTQLPQICRDCVSDCRGAFAYDTMAMADMLAVDVRRNPAFPAHIDMSKLLHSWRRRVYRKIELAGDARMERTGGLRRYHLPPGAQILVRFASPCAVADILYRGKFRISGARLLVGIKDWGKDDIWNYSLDPEELALLGEWIGLPMPPMPLDLRSPDLKDLCLFVWAPIENTEAANVVVKKFEGLAVRPTALDLDNLQIRHIWSAR